jgi:hypothetical protein
MATQTLPYKLNVIHRPGLDTADYFSRNPIEPPDSLYEDLSERFIASINAGAADIDTDE